MKDYKSLQTKECLVITNETMMKNKETQNWTFFFVIYYRVPTEQPATSALSLIAKKN
jgi:hypothetical protein